jgi:predicted anti-sigma-YlaC factor YlaD
LVGCIELARRRIRAGVGVLEASCATTTKALSDRLEGELRGLRRLRVGRHLARCGRCRAALASLARAVHALRTLRDAEPVGHGTAVEQVLDRIREGSERDESV